MSEEAIYEGLCREFHAIEESLTSAYRRTELDGILSNMAQRLAEAGLTEWPPKGNRND